MPRVVGVRREFDCGAKHVQVVVFRLVGEQESPREYGGNRATGQHDIVIVADPQAKLLLNRSEGGKRRDRLHPGDPGRKPGREFCSRLLKGPWLCVLPDPLACLPAAPPGRSSVVIPVDDTNAVIAEDADHGVESVRRPTLAFPPGALRSVVLGIPTVLPPRSLVPLLRDLVGGRRDGHDESIEEHDVRNERTRRDVIIDCVGAPRLSRHQRPLATLNSSPRRCRVALARLEADHRDHGN